MSVLTAQAAMVFNVKNMISPAFRKMASDAQAFGASAARSFKRAADGARKAQGGMNLMQGAIGAMAGFFAVGQITNFANEAITAFGESQAAIANIEAGLKSTGNAIGMTSGEFVKMAEAYQKTTIFEDDAILQNVTAQMLTFGNVGKENFNRVQGAVLDLTAKVKGINATGDDLKGFAIQMGKAMDNPVKGITALSKSGVSFSDAEKEMIKDMVAANKMLDAQNLILSSIERQYGGTAAALAGTDAGKIINKQHSIGNSMENIGQVLIGVKAAFLDVGSYALEALSGIITTGGDSKNVIESIVKTGKGFIDFLQTAFKFLTFIAPLVLPIVAAVIAWNTALAVYNGIMAISAAVQVAYATATGTATTAQVGLNLAMIANPIGLIVLGIGALIGVIVLCVIYIDKITAAIKTAWQWVTNLATVIYTQAIAGFNQFKDVLALLLGPIGLIINAIVMLKDNWASVQAAFTEGGILGAIQRIGELVLLSILQPIQKVLGLIAKIPGMGGLVGNINTALGDTVSKLQAPNAETAEGQWSGSADVNVNFVNAPANTTTEFSSSGGLNLATAGLN